MIHSQIQVLQDIHDTIAGGHSLLLERNAPPGLCTHVHEIAHLHHVGNTFVPGYGIPDFQKHIHTVKASIFCSIMSVIQVFFTLFTGWM